MTPELEAGLRSLVERRATDHLVVAVLPVGSSSEPLVIGQDETLVAWSTSKVPVALAALRQARTASNQEDARLALTASSNEAALRLWGTLGSPTTAKVAVERVLADGGDARTHVESKVTRPGYTPFGQTQWALADQVRFAANLLCLQDSSLVTGHMGAVTLEHRWGAGRVPGSLIKGGWGPTPGGFVLRQMAIVPAGTRRGTALAFQVRTAAGEAHAIAVADEVGAVMRAHTGDLPTGNCS